MVRTQGWNNEKTKYKIKMTKLVSDYIRSVLPHMEGWCTPDKATALAECVLDLKPDVCVEIGVFAGKSLIAIALACHENSKGRVIGIDPWDKDASVQGFSPSDPNHQWWRDVVNHSYIMGQCTSFVKQMGINSRVHLCRGTAEHTLPGMLLVKDLFGRPFIDLLHIDGNHSEICSTFDVENYVPLVTSGGTVVFDDVNWVTTTRAQQRLTELCDLERYVETEGQKCGFFRRKGGA